MVLTMMIDCVVIRWHSSPIDTVYCMFLCIVSCGKNFLLEDDKSVPPVPKGLHIAREIADSHQQQPFGME